MKVIFFKGTSPGVAGWFDRGARFRLSGPYSHCEVVFEPGDDVEDYMPDKSLEIDSEGRYWCFSSNFFDVMPAWSKRRAGKKGGARYRRIYLDPQLWDVIDIPFIKATDVIDLIDELEGLRYDLFGWLKFITWFFQHQKSRITCYEIVAIACDIEEPHRYDTCNLAAILRSMVRQYHRAMQIAPNVPTLHDPA